VVSAFTTDESRPMARGTVIVEADPTRSTQASCAVPSWAADSVGAGVPIEILGSDEAEVGRGLFHDEDHPGNYFDESHTECAFNFEVAYTPGSYEEFYVANGDYWSGDISRDELEEGVVLTLPRSPDGEGR
jgi:hypothetical protein